MAVGRIFSLPLFQSQLLREWSLVTPTERGLFMVQSTVAGSRDPGVRYDPGKTHRTGDAWLGLRASTSCTRQ